MKIMSWIGLAVERVRGWSGGQKLLAALVGLGAMLALFGTTATHKLPAPAGSSIRQVELYNDQPDSDRQSNEMAGQGTFSELAANQLAPAKKTDMARTRETGVAGLPASSQPYAATNPMIAHSAELAVATKEFVQSRSTLEEILERHRGYAAKLRMVGQKSGSVLSAMLRVVMLCCCTAEARSKTPTKSRSSMRTSKRGLRTRGITCIVCRNC